MKKIYKQTIFTIAIVTVSVFLGIGPIAYVVSYDSKTIGEILLVLLFTDLGLLLIGLLSYSLYKLSEWAEL